ncbi:MAG: hypothetical protein PHO23_03165 [Candidatus Pacebacteria bacterium]|nr:hypothetical protein [Candidatus Paceibacterota bacterium]
MFVESTNARSGEYVEYEIVIRNNSNSTIQNVVVYDPIPTPLMYVTGSTKINGITNVDGIATSGIILGTLKPQQTVTINLNAYLYSNTNVYSMLLNKVQVRSNNYSEVIDSASVVVNAMYGSGYIETGP